MKKINRRVVLALGIVLSLVVLINMFFGSREELADIIEVVTQGNKVLTQEADKCYYDSSCALPQMLFRMRTETDSAPPFSCLNDIRLFDDNSIEKGINIAVLNGTTGDILMKSTFDVKSSDEKLMRWLIDLPHASILVAASFGDVAEHVSRQARQLFGAFGASKIDGWRGGNAYSLIGQRGINKGEGYEMISPFNEPSTEVFEGCIELPIAEPKVVELKFDGPDVHRADESKLAELGAVAEKKDVEFGQVWTNCGMEKGCSEDSIPIHLFSGEHKDDHPKMCIGGRMLFDKNLNRAGRGLNMAMLEPKTGKVTAVVNFDTYEDETTNLEEWLDAIPTGYIVVVVSFDEASTMLSDMARHIFYEMGSSMVERLKFRASWYFIGQKGIGAYTPFEDLNVPTGNNWANPIRTSFCLPKSLYKWSGRKDLPASSNDAKNLPKRHFCAKYDRHEEFCSAQNLDEPIVPKIMHNEKRANEPIFNLPILVASGLAPDSLRATLQSLMNQEGINTQMVIVAYDKEYPENADLASLFHVKSVPIVSNGNYNALLLSSLLSAFSVFPETNALIVIEEDVTLSVDWLQYFSEIYDGFMKDEKTDLALAFNPNGFEDTSGLSSTVYRVAGQLPIGSYILKRDLYEKHIRLREFCCIEKGNWDLRDANTIVPALSRIEINFDELEKENSLFRRKRISSKASSLIDQQFESEEAYKQKLEIIGERARVKVTTNDIINMGCEKWKESVNESEPSIIIKYSTSSEVEQLFNCLGYYYSPKVLRKNENFRFSLHRTTEVLIMKY